MPSLEFRRVLDRKSTRLNSSHGSISYAVFCLKKNKSGLPHFQVEPGLAGCDTRQTAQLRTRPQVLAPRRVRRLSLSRFLLLWACFFFLMIRPPPSSTLFPPPTPFH